TRGLDSDPSSPLGGVEACCMKDGVRPVTSGWLASGARFLVSATVVAAARTLETTAVRPEAARLIGAESGQGPHAGNATPPWYPASVTKIMTTYVVLKAVKDGRISLDKLVTVSDNAVAQQPSKMGFKAGTQLTVDNAIKMLMVKSANDMAVVLAEGLSG